jgi:hypothetical protein
MSEFHFHLYRGHLSAKLIRAVESEFSGVSVVNYTEPRGEKRGWFNGPNRGHPFDNQLAKRVGEFLRTTKAASPSDLERLSLMKEDA